MKNIIIVGLIMMACATVTTTKVITSYTDWDANKDGALQRTEFIDGYTDSNYFSRWSNRGNSISYNDFLVDAFNFLDKNRNADIEKLEFDDQIDAYYFGKDQNSYTQMDKQSDVLIDN